MLAPEGWLLIEVPNVDVDANGNECLSMVGAIHPLGYSASWFRRNLVNNGLVVWGFFDRWDAVPECTRQGESTSVIIVAARSRRSRRLNE